MNNKTYALYPPKARLFLMFILALLLVAASLLCILISSSVIYRIACTIGVVFFSCGGIYLIYRLVTPKPSLIIDAMGITDHSAALTFGFIKWSEIDRIFLTSFVGKKMLAIVPTNQEIFLAKFNPIVKQTALANINLIKAPFAISEQNLPVKIDQLIAEIKKYYPNKIEVG